MVHVTFVGLATLDIIQLVERLPHPNEKVAALDFVIAAGGPAANAAVACTHRGGAATLITRLPTHPLSDTVTRDLERYAVKVHALPTDTSGPPVTASIMVTESTGDRAVVSPTAQATNARAATPDSLPELGNTDVLLMDGYFPELALPLARSARAQGIPVALDAGSHKPHTPAVLEHTDIAIVSDDFTTATGNGDPEAVIAYVSSFGVSTTVITRGAGPVIVHSAQGRQEIAPREVAVVDTLGAGDFFHGAFAWAFASGLGLADAVEAGCATAAQSLSSFGTRAWLER